MTMSKHDYELIAETFSYQYRLRGTVRESAYTELAKALADTFERDNPRFNRSEFLWACLLGGPRFRSNIDMSDITTND